MTNLDLIERNELNQNSRGGTELLQERLYDGLVPRELLQEFQIVFSRARELDPNRRKIFYAHDLPEDPESSRLSDPMFRKKFDRFVFVSHWQLEQYNKVRGVEYARSTVIRNSIMPLPDVQREPSDKIRLIYHSTPHRGLEILIPVFLKLAETQPDIELNVYSSFNLYGWGDRDEQYKQLFDICKDHPQINYHGTVSNDELRNALLQNDIFGYPSIWRETSCLSLIEAMSGKLLCVHPNLAALPETSMGLTWMYQWSEDPQMHAQHFYQVLNTAINVVRTQREALQPDLQLQKIQVDRIHNWPSRAEEWTNLLRALKEEQI